MMYTCEFCDELISYIEKKHNCKTGLLNKFKKNHKKAVFFIENSEDINAGCVVAENKIFITKKFFNLLNKEELYAVLAHEVAHLYLKHPEGTDRDHEYTADLYAVEVLNANRKSLINSLKKANIKLEYDHIYKSNEFIHPNLLERALNLGLTKEYVEEMLNENLY